MLFFGTPILIAAAVLPAFLLMKKIYRADRLEKEPLPLLLSLLFWGIAATFVAIVFETIGGAALEYCFGEGTLAYNILLYFGVVAFSEEGAKYMLLKRRTWNAPDFNCRFDGVVYAVFVALGFALWENIGYVFSYGLGTALLRAVTAVPGHACFGVFMGVWYSRAKYHELRGEEAEARSCCRAALFVPALLHGAYDFIATNEYFVFGFIAFIAAMFWSANRAIKRGGEEDRYFDPELTEEG